MDCDFLLLNGDTVFDSALLAQVLNSESAPITLSIDYKKVYDEPSPPLGRLLEHYHGSMNYML